MVHLWLPFLIVKNEFNILREKFLWETKIEHKLTVRKPFTLPILTHFSACSSFLESLKIEILNLLLENVKLLIIKRNCIAVCDFFCTFAPVNLTRRSKLPMR